MGVSVVDHDPAWTRAFERLRDRLWPAVAHVAQRMEHVGSTSVPNLPAKPILDVDIVVETADRVAPTIECLAPLGYVHRGDLGIPGREAFHGPDTPMRHHLYVCVEGSAALRNHLLVRDVLRRDAALAARYGSLKRKLAAAHADDIDAYCEGKTAFIVGVLAAHGMSPGDVAAIELANRNPPDPASSC